MKYRVLGKTGLRISRMGLGGIPIQRIDAEGTMDTPEGIALRERIGDLFQRAEGTLN